MEIGQIKRCREDLEAESIDTEDLALIEAAYAEIPDDKLRDLRVNATASDMLDEIEANIPQLAWVIYDYVCENFGDNEADDPSWYITPLAKHIESQLVEVDGEQVKLGTFLEGRM